MAAEPRTYKIHTNKLETPNVVAVTPWRERLTWSHLNWSMPGGLGVLSGFSGSLILGELLAIAFGLLSGLAITTINPDAIYNSVHMPLMASLGVVSGLLAPLVITWRDHRFKHIAVVPQKWRRSLDRASIALQIQKWGRLEHQRRQLGEMRSGFDAFEEYAEAYQESIDYELDILKSSIATITTDIDRAVADDLFARGRP